MMRKEYRAQTLLYGLRPFLFPIRWGLIIQRYMPETGRNNPPGTLSLYQLEFLVQLFAVFFILRGSECIICTASIYQLSE